MKRILVLIFLCVALVSCLFARETYTVDQVPNVNLSDRTKYVSDPERFLSSSATAQADSILWHLRQATSAEVVAVVLPSFGDTSVEEFATELFNKWGLGKKDKDNGVLLLISVNDRVAKIETGYGVEGALPDITAKKIITHAIAPNMINGNVDKAVVESVDLISKVLTDPALADEILSKEADNFSGSKGVDKAAISQFIRYIASGVFLLALLLFIIDLLRCRRKNNYFKALYWREHLPIYFAATIFSLGAGVIFLLLAWLLVKRYRNKKIKCDTCGAKMRKLSEEDDNLLLSPAQDLEERLNTVDYDVWECPDCGTIERFPFKQRQSKYSACERCGTIASELVCDKILSRPTTSKEGRGVKIYKCRFCGHEVQKPYTIPKKEVPVVVPIIGGGGGSGGGFGGGFGGGMSGGGGATGRW